jgi:hypothetical protein
VQLPWVLRFRFAATATIRLPLRGAKPHVNKGSCREAEQRAIHADRIACRPAGPYNADMSENLSIQGDLSETTVPDLFRTVIRSGETAVLLLESEGQRDTIYFHEGRLVYATTLDPDKGLAETLLRAGELDIEQYNRAMDRLVVARKVGALLCELGYLQPDDLSQVVERQVNSIVLNAIGYRSGSYTMEFVPELPDATVTLSLHTERLILDGIRDIDSWSLIWRGVGRLERFLQHSPEADRRTFQLELTEEESHILALLSEPRSVEQLCARSYLSNFLTCRTIWGLLSVNLIQDGQISTSEETQSAAEIEYELEAIVEQFNGVYQQIFSRVFQKIGDHVYDFMDRVVLHLSPQMVPFLSGMSFVNEGRLDFDQLLNNLFSTPTADHPRVVRAVLDGLLNGWVAEVKAEFAGHEIESEVVRLAEGLRGGHGLLPPQPPLIV